MTTKTLPAHGTTARAKGRPASGIKGCPCRPCRDAENAYDKRRRYLKATGRSLTVDAEEAAKHIDALFDAGAGWTQLAVAAGVSNSTLSEIRRRAITQIYRSTATKILAVQLGDAQPARCSVPATGTLRRLQALTAIGHTTGEIAAVAALDPATVRRVLRTSPATVSDHTAERIDSAYRKLAAVAGLNTRARNRAAQFGWAPPIAWDDDTIADPSAHPDWTGHCGTDRGWWLHRANNIPTCQPCTQAHQEWCDQHKHLDGKQRWAAASKARAEAASRGVAIAANARELFTQGYTTDQVALRLGVGRDRIEQELRRHPNATNELEAAA